MDFKLSSDQKMIQETVKKFAVNELQPLASEFDKTGSYPKEIVKKMADLGLMGGIIPEEYGGGAMDMLSLAIAVEELSKVCSSTAVILVANTTLTSYPIMEFGNEALKKKYLPTLISEKTGAFCLTEPAAGSDVARLETTAKLEGDNYIINGTKQFITNGGEAEIYIVCAYTDKSKAHKGMSVFVVERGFPGVSIGKHEDLLGVRATANCEMIFTDCKVPKENIIGEEGDGFKICLSTIDASRIDIAAQAVGLAQGALDAAVQYSKGRIAFGKPICQHQAIQDKIATMATKIQAARLMTYWVASLKDEGQKNIAKEAAMAKFFASDIAMDVTREAIQIFGGYGYTKDYPVERFYRDAKITEIYEGTTEMQKMTIAKAILG